MSDEVYAIKIPFRFWLLFLISLVPILGFFVVSFLWYCNYWAPIKEHRLGNILRANALCLATMIISSIPLIAMIILQEEVNLGSTWSGILMVLGTNVLVVLLVLTQRLVFKRYLLEEEYKQYSSWKITTIPSTFQAPSEQIEKIRQRQKNAGNLLRFKMLILLSLILFFNFFFIILCWTNYFNPTFTKRFGIVKACIVCVITTLTSFILVSPLGMLFNHVSALYDAGPWILITLASMLMIFSQRIIFKFSLSEEDYKKYAAWRSPIAKHEEEISRE